MTDKQIDTVEQDERAAWRDHPAALDAKALATAQEIALMWGRDRSQFVSRIQVAVRDAMDWVRAASTSANVAQGAEAIYQAKIIVDPKWTDVAKSEFDNYVELGGFDTRVVYTAPPAQTALTVSVPKAPTVALYAVMREHNLTLEGWDAILTAAQSASGDTK